MSAPDIENWIASSTTSQLDDDDREAEAAGDTYTLDRARKDWSGFLQYAQSRLLSSRTKERVAFLTEQLLPITSGHDLSIAEALSIFRSLSLTYPRYIDHTSREAVEVIVKELVGQNNNVSHQIIEWIRSESGRICNRGRSRSSSAANRFVLLKWCCVIYGSIVKTNAIKADGKEWKALIECIALLFDSLVDEDMPAKSALRKTTIVCARRCLRSSPKNVSSVINTTTLGLLKENPTSGYLVTLLGLACDVTYYLKHVPDDLRQLSTTTQKEIVQVYTSSVVASRTPIPKHVSAALSGFIGSYLSEDDFRSSILPAMERSALRSPEVSLPVMTDFFRTYKHDLEGDSFRRVFTTIMNSAKSSNPTTRSNAIALSEVLLRRSVDPAAEEHSLNEVMSPVKSGKSVGSEHRLALYSILHMIRPSPIVSASIVENVPPLLVKESSDIVVQQLARAAVPHFVFVLRADAGVPSSSLNTLVREMQGSKPALRRSLSCLIGAVLFQCAEEDIRTPAFDGLRRAAVPVFEANLKAVAANPLGGSASPLEGYVALASLLGPVRKCHDFDLSSHNAIIQSLVVSAGKPSFLLWDKVYQKLSSEEEETWLGRALSEAFTSLIAEIEKLDFIRRQFGHAFLHLAAQSRHLEVRRSVAEALGKLHARMPQETNAVLRVAISSLLEKDNDTSSDPSANDSDKHRLHRNIIPVLAACASFADESDPSEKERLLAELVLVAHQPALTSISGQLWIDLCQRAKVDPHQLVVQQKELLLALILSQIPSKTLESATTTLTFVAPEIILPPLIDQIKDDLSPECFASVSQEDVEIWKAPEGTLYRDVLTSRGNGSTTRKGKDAAIEKWEAELRASIASKKASGSKTLSKQEQEMVAEQLRIESGIRKRVSSIIAKVARGFLLLQAIVNAKVDELGIYFADLVNLLLVGAVDRGGTLLGNEAADAYLDLGRYCANRLDSLRKWVGVATLRCHNPGVVADELKAEPLNALVLRVLYRIRTLSEQNAFDAATFSYIAALLSCVIEDDSAIGDEDEDEPLERIALIIAILNFHTRDFSDVRFPRSRILSDLLHIIKKYPSLGKDASSVLIGIGEAINVNSTLDEIRILVESTLASEAYVRNSALQCLQTLDLTDLDWSPELWIACHDADQQNARVARHVWEDNGLDIPESFFNDLCTFLVHEHACIRTSCASALTEAIEQWPQQGALVMRSLQELYREKTKITGPEYDDFGILTSRSTEANDPWQARLAVAQSFEALAPLLLPDLVVPFIQFLIDEEVLGDSKQEVRSGVLRAASKVVDLHGAQHLQPLIAVFETYLTSSTPTSDTADYVKEAVVILLGRTASHLSAEDERIPSVVSRLVEALKTPSEQVQIAVSECLAPLVKLIKQSVPKLIDELLHELSNAPKYGERKGAAYGLAGIIKGVGIAGISKFNIVDRLRASLEEKKRYEPRQGAMFVLETLSASLGRDFEPYIIELLPSLLASFGDPVPDVREAAEDAAKVIMANLSGYGVKCILPTLLSGLDEKQWRTKKGSIELLGTMAFCAPEQLSISLPTVIPRLTGVLTDSHAQVRTAANRSLKQFGEVISNPEIHALVPVLLKAFVDPAKTAGALTSLLKKSFAHYIDSPSLALVIPIIERGLKERGADTKRKAVQIVGNLASLTESQDFIPYLTRLLPLVHVVLVDPVPGARATAAKALGTLIERLGEEQFPDMVPNLLRILKTDTSGVDRQGAAQGLSEVLAGLGMERLESLLPDIVSNAQSPKSTVREGFMSLLVYLPSTFGVRFQPHLTKIVGPILSGLSDTEEYVREAAMRAGRMIITNYSNRAIDLLLPELERGMFDSSWRIRHSSITLVGELLFKVSGISGKAEIEEDEEVEVTAAEGSRKALAEVLGKERRDRVLSALYIVRQDAVSVVRQSAIHIWKALVHNTPRAVRELLHELISQLVNLLVEEEGGESQETASRTIGEICRKFGERVLGEILPILRTKSTSSDSRTREGACLALCDIMTNATDTQRGGHEDDIVTIVRAALVDDEANVRSAAAKAFDSLQEHLGAKAIDQTIPTLLEALRQPGEGSETALQALKEVMAVRASTVFPVLIPTLTVSPMTVFNARALASLVTVAGNALSKRLTQVLGALVTNLEADNSEELREALDEALKALLSSIADAEGLNTLMLLLLDWVQSGGPIRRASSCTVFGIFCEESELDDSLYRVDWIRQLVKLMDDPEVIVHTAAWQALDHFVKSVPKDELEALVVSLRRSIESCGAPGRFVPGFSLPKGIAPMVPIIIAGLTTGSNEQRENAASAIGDLVIRTEENAIKPFVVPFTGPLIRVAAQSSSYPPGVKSAILVALKTMLSRIPSFVKPFFPQLQRTFVKATSDTSSLAVRNKAADALGELMKSQPRVDPVITELVAGVKISDEPIAASHVKALAKVVKNAGENIGDKTRLMCIELIEEAYREPHDEQYIQAVALLFAALQRFPELLQPVIREHLMPGTPPSVLSSHSILAVLSKNEEEEEEEEEEDDDDDSAQGVPNLFEQLDIISSIARKVQENIAADRPSISRPAREAKELLSKYS
ncbi:GCN1 [Sanghuangporus weigelae]